MKIEVFFCKSIRANRPDSRCESQGHLSANKGLPLPLGRGVCETENLVQKWALQSPDPENPLLLGFSVLGGGLRPWSQTMPDHGVGVDPSLLNLSSHGRSSKTTPNVSILAKNNT